MIQHSLDIGILVTWTKTFNCPDVVNEDAVKLLREALDRRGDTKVKVVAILNDTQEHWYKDQRWILILQLDLY